MGGTATAAQILVIRELLVAFSGTELSIGVILANWLILEALGSYWSRKKAAYSQRHVKSFALLQVSIGTGCVLSVLFIRSFKYLFHLSTGEILSFPYMAIISLAALAPVAILDGVLFPLGCRGLAQFSRKGEAAARVYLYQAIGSFVAALGFVFYLIAWLNSVELAVILLVFNCCSAVFYLTATGHARWLRNSIIVLLILSCCTFFLKGPALIHDISSRILWYEHELRETRNSVYANIAVVSKESQYTFFSNGMPYATTPQPGLLIEERSHLPMLFHDQPEKVLVIGGGAGGILNEILKHPVTGIDYAEQDPLIISFFEKFATPLTEYELNHEKVVIHSLEGRLYLRKTEKLYDLILVNLPVPSTLLLNRYYTVEFFRQGREHLAEGGLFTISLPGSETFLSQELKNLNQTIFASLKVVFPSVKILAGNENIFVAAADMDLDSIMQDSLIKRLDGRDISAGLITAPYILYKTDQERFGPLAEEISKSTGDKVNQDLRPASVFESMMFLNIIAWPVFARLLAAMENISLSACLIILGLAMLLLLAFQQRSGKRVYIMTSIISTGFAGMFMNMTMILAFQIYYGNVYHYIGLLTSLFMFGLACGAFFAMKRSRPAIVPIEAAIVIHTLVVFSFFAAKPEGILISSFIIFALCILSGVLTGAEYPVAVSLSSQSGPDISVTGSKLYAADLLGAFFGAIVTPVFLLPVMGIKNALLFITVLKGGSLAMAYIGERKNNQMASVK
jgi:spermidine synthase